MPDDLKVTATTWTSVTLTENERWQVILGQARLSLDTTPAIGSMSLESGILLKNFAWLDFANGDVVRYRRNGTSPCTIARSKR